MFLTLQPQSRKKKKVKAKSSSAQNAGQKILSRNFPLSILSKIFLKATARMKNPVPVKIKITNVAAQNKI